MLRYAGVRIPDFIATHIQTHTNTNDCFVIQIEVCGRTARSN